MRTRPETWPRRHAVVYLAACACLANASSRAEDAGPAPARPAEIVVTRAGHECFTGLVHAAGYLVPRRTAVVMFPVAGYRITEVKAKVGDTIKQGDVVARAAPIDQAATGQPASGPAGPRPPAAKSDVAADVAVTSLASGVILQSTAFVGLLTSATSKPLFTLAVDGEIEASVEVPSVHVPELTVGQAARLTMRDGRVLAGHVRRTPAVIDPASQMGSARLSIDHGQGLELSRFVRATIEARRSCGIGVPMEALRRTSAGITVQVVKGDVITDRSVALGLADETRSEVTSGLTEGDLVVSGTGSSRNGDRVKPVLPDLRDTR